MNAALGSTRGHTLRRWVEVRMRYLVRPLTAGAVEIGDGVEDVSAWALDGPPGGFWLGKERLEELPFAVGEVTGIGLGWVYPKLDVWKL